MPLSPAPALRRSGLGRQLRNPTGPAGWLLGQAMALANRRANRAAIAALGVQPGDDVLELGFGPGAAIRRLVALTPLGKVYGIDASATMLRLAARRNRGALRAGRVELKQGRFNSLPLPDAVVSKVLAVNVVYFWDEPRQILEEVCRVLRPGGRIAVYATDAAAMRRWRFAAGGTHRTFDRAALTALLESGGFEPGSVRLNEVRVAPMLRGWVATARRDSGAQGSTS